MSLVGRLAYVTGAASGIGRAACQCLAREGATIVAVDKNISSLLQTIESLPSVAQPHMQIATSVENKESIESSLKKVLTAYSAPPTIVVNAAGIIRDNFISKLSEEDFIEVLDVNLKGTFLVIKTFANALVSHKVNEASIINIGSVVAKFGNIGQANYCASKAGVDLLTKVASKEYGKFGIRVNNILPGFIATPMTSAIPEKVRDKFLPLIPLGRFGQPEEMAEVIAFLASRKSSYINGATIEVTGGF
ncbi:(3R)-3-hydroxyacyl-CoA dehydrogenase [Euwallacea similis]|uniref:(3R)-3-hydroxyacyl-CoA dehydrogenase n=1 Tax=Euwallacea similis TaxID=1736056 RepID=UPI0034501B6B